MGALKQITWCILSLRITSEMDLEDIIYRE